ncbi:MAG: polyprenyl synthetase family protein [Calditrichaceae bacterium]
MGAAAQLGAMTTSDKPEDHERLKVFGENLGLAFQIQDDLLDYYGKQSIVGKPIGNDFKDKKITLPLIHAFQNAEEKKIKEIKKLLKYDVSSKDVSYIIQFVENYGGIEYTKQRQNDYAFQAQKSLNSYENNDVKEALLNFIEFIINRTK